MKESMKESRGNQGGIRKSRGRSTENQGVGVLEVQI